MNSKLHIKREECPLSQMLTLKAPMMTVADDSLDYFFLIVFL